MNEFARVGLTLKKTVHRGDKESLLSLFDPVQRFKPMVVLMDAEEDSVVRANIGQLGEIDLKLGADMRTNKQKTIMTLFWYSERSKTFEIKTDTERGKTIDVQIMLV